MPENNKIVSQKVLKSAFEVMCLAKYMTEIYETNKELTSKYVHATSRGHEAVQIAMGMHLEPQDWVAPYYRDDALLLSIGMTPYELMLQLLAKKMPPFLEDAHTIHTQVYVGIICPKSLTNLQLLECRPFPPLEWQWVFSI